eukprot:3490650-Pleurochrysis_carterae.AAC.2
MLPTCSKRSCTSAGPAQRSSHAPAAPPPLALSTPPHRLLPIAPQGLRTKEFLPPRATNNATNKEVRNLQTSPQRVKPSV